MLVPARVASGAISGTAIASIAIWTTKCARCSTSWSTRRSAPACRPQAARRAATLELGRVDAITQQVREARAGASVDALLQGRALRRAHAARQSRLHARGRAVAGRRHRRQQRALLGGQRLAAARAAGAGAGAAARGRASSRGCRSRRGSRIRSSSSCATGFPTPDGVAAMSRVTRARMPTASGEPESASVQLVSGEFFNVLRLHAAARTLALARRQSHHGRRIPWR